MSSPSLEACKPKQDHGKSTASHRGQLNPLTVKIPSNPETVRSSLTFCRNHKIGTVLLSRSLWMDPEDHGRSRWEAGSLWSPTWGRAGQKCLSLTLVTRGRIMSLHFPPPPTPPRPPPIVSMARIPPISACQYRTSLVAAGWSDAAGTERFIF